MSGTTLITTWYGSFLVTDGAVTAKRLFPQEPAAVADRLGAARSGQVLDEEKALAEEAAGPLAVQEKRLAGLGTVRRKGLVVAPPFKPEASGYKTRLLREALLLLAVREANLDLAQRDRLVVQEVRALDDIVRSANLLAERMREWYAIHSPEAVGAIPDHADLARLIERHGSREGLAGEVAGITMDLGVPFPEADERIMQEFATGLRTLYDTWARIEKRITDAMEEIAPNTSIVVGPMLGARLIAGAGGLERLAVLPSGTVQTLGAENALFRHLKEGNPPPKHGTLYQHEAVNRAPRWQRGKISRALAGKVSIAAKVDAYGEDKSGDVGRTLLEGFRIRHEEIRKKHAQPPPRAPRPGYGSGPRSGDRRGPGRGPRGPGRGPPQRGRAPHGRQRR
ncbi:MAG: ribosomal biogenesis protein [Euryarchaeota archaeon]|nr:ribosomal biogenesis protein [Euryarchaeota archaeon]